MRHSTMPVLIPPLNIRTWHHEQAGSCLKIKHLTVAEVSQHYHQNTEQLTNMCTHDIWNLSRITRGRCVARQRRHAWSCQQCPLMHHVALPLQRQSCQPSYPRCIYRQVAVSARYTLMFKLQLGQIMLCSIYLAASCTNCFTPKIRLHHPHG